MVSLTVASPKVITRKCPVLPSTDSVPENLFQILSEFRTMGIVKLSKIEIPTIIIIVRPQQFLLPTMRWVEDLSMKNVCNVQNLSIGHVTSKFILQFK
jgi:hypothetical protein